jgi:hypothetical protein
VAKASSTLGFLRRNLQHCPRECRRTACIAFVRSIMEYGSVIWDTYTKQEIKLESIQRSEARFITKDCKSREEGCMTKMLNELNLPTLQFRRQKKLVPSGSNQQLFVQRISVYIDRFYLEGSLYIYCCFLPRKSLYC